MILFVLRGAFVLQLRESLHAFFASLDLLLTVALSLHLLLTLLGRGLRPFFVSANMQPGGATWASCLR